MLTRCPACQTAFKVAPDQLAARAGRVRCGHCLNAFDAIANALPIPEPPAEEAPPQDLTAPPLPPERAPSDPGAVGDILAVQNVASDLTPPDLPPTALPEEADSSADDDVPGTDEMPAVLRARHRAPREADPDVEDQAEAAPTSQPESPPPPPLPPDAPQPDLPAPEAPALWPREASRIDESDGGTPTPTTATLSTPVPALALAHQDADDNPATLAPPPSVMPLRVPASPPEGEAGQARRQWGIALGCLAMLLAAQASFLFRSQVAEAFPFLRPAFVALCTQVGCAMPLPQEAGAIGIETSDLHPEPGPNAEFVFHATLRNRADFAQAYPHVELSLTDAADKPVVRRVFPPQEWLPAGTAEDAPFSGGAAAEARLAFSAPGVAALGYRVYVFYP